MIKKYIGMLALGLLSIPCLANKQQTFNVDAVTGAKSWATQAHGVYFSLTQILPEQGQAFYVNRGFTLKQIEPYISSCVYMTVLRNDSAPGVIHFISNDWPVVANGKRYALVSVDEWMEKLTTSKAIKPALVAFRWAQFPVEQEYEPGGDWNQGMLSIGLPAGSQFDIIAHWDVDGKVYEAQLHGVECAK